jgi:hypothetical protein
MKRSGFLLAAAILWPALAAGGPAAASDGSGIMGGFGWDRWWPSYAGMGWAWGWNSPWWGYPYYAYGYGYPYGYYGGAYNDPYGYGQDPYGYGQPAAAGDAPLAAGRSIAAPQAGDYCTTPARTCKLARPSYAGNGCSCRVPGGRARGTVTP